MSKSFIKPAALIMAGATIMYSMSTFAFTTIETNILNAVQTIKRTVFTSDGTTSGTVLLDINTGSKIYMASGVLSNTLANRVLGLDANGYVTTNVSLPSGNGTGSDADWYEVGTTTSPNNINDNIYTLGKAAIGITDPVDAVLRVVGNVVFGDTGNRAGYAARFSSVL